MNSIHRKSSLFSFFFLVWHLFVPSAVKQVRGCVLEESASAPQHVFEFEYQISGDSGLEGLNGFKTAEPRLENVY